MRIKVELTNGIYGHYEYIDTAETGYEDEEIPMGEFPSDTRENFLVGWLEGLAQSDNAPFWAWESGEALRVIVSNAD